MTRSWLLNATLLIIVVALGGFIYLKPRSNEPASYPLSTLQAATVAKIRLERTSRTPIVLEKKSGQWFITAPVAAPAEPFQVQRLLSILATRASSRLAATDLTRFDLDRPVARLTVDSQTFSFGIENKVAREQYVLTENAVYPIDSGYGATLPADATQLIRRQLFAGNEAPAHFEFGNFTVASAGGKWSVVPAPGDLSQDDINRWVDDWRLASALHAEPYAGAKAIGAIRVEFKDGRKTTLDILQREPELVLLRRDQNLQYAFFPETAKRLLSRPGSQRSKSQNSLPRKTQR